MRVLAEGEVAPSSGGVCFYGLQCTIVESLWPLLAPKAYATSELQGWFAKYNAAWDTLPYLTLSNANPPE